MRLYLKSINYYPYYTLPSNDDINSFDDKLKKEYYSIKESGLLKELLWTEIFFKMQQINKYQISTVPTKGAPRNLSIQDFDIFNGTINYPTALLDNTFDMERCILNNKIKDFCLENNKTCNSYLKAQQAIDNLLIKIEKNITINSDLSAKLINFLHSLEYSIRKLI